MILLFQICAQKPSWINSGYKVDNYDDDDNDVEGGNKERHDGDDDDDDDEDDDDDDDDFEGGNKERHVWISCGCCFSQRTISFCSQLNQPL